MVLGEILGMVLGGGATGLIGSAVNRYFDIQKAKSDLLLTEANHRHEREVKQIDFQIMSKEWEMRDKIAITESEGRSDVAASEAFAASYALEPKLYSNTSLLTKGQNAWLAIVDGIRGIVRPGITAYLCIVSTAVWMQAGAILKLQPIPIIDSINIYQQITATILFNTNMCIAWWFGSRMPNKKK
jgi:hypothetical protein